MESLASENRPPAFTEFWENADNPLGRSDGSGGEDLKRRQRILVVALVIAGAYFLVFHEDPLPLNHESVGLGFYHTLHDVIGIVLLGCAGVVWWLSRRGSRLARASS